MKRRVWTGLILLILVFFLPGIVAAQEGVHKWLRYDVNINVQQNSGITVEEIQEVVLNQGVTSFRRVIPTTKLDDITNVTVLQNPTGNQRTFQLADTQAEYTFQILSEPDQKVIQLYFPPNNAPSTTFVIRYFVVGGLRFYDDGDRFDWQPFGARVNAPIDTSTTVIKLPGQFTDDQIARDHTGLANVNTFLQDSDRVAFTTTNVPAGSQPEVFVTFPHGVVQGSPPGWQSEVDTLEFWSPILRWGSLLLGVLLLLVCPLAVLGWWYLRVRLSPTATGKAPKYLKGPPSDLSPAVAGMLVDGKVNPRHIVATLLDLAYQGTLNINSIKKDPDSLLPDDDESEPNFEFYGVDQAKATRPYEASLYGKIFGYAGAKKRRLSAIRQTMYLSVPEFKNEIEFEVAKREFFAENIGGLRRQYWAFGGAGILMSLVLALLVGVILSRFTYLGACPFLGIAVGAGALMAVGFSLPKRTETGAKEVVRWEAFKRYLTDMGVKDAAKARARFTQLLPYAVAFGVEKQFVEKFAAAKTPVPPWWGKPEEKLPDIGHDQAHAWVSSSYLSDATAQSKPQKPAAKGVIRRLGESAGESQQGAVLLNQIKPELVAFLEAGLEVFAKAPDLEEGHEVDFDALKQ